MVLPLKRKLIIEQQMGDLRAPSLLCKVCNKNFAPESVTGRLLTGDIFVLYTCPGCSESGSQILERLPMNWVLIIQLVLYHLHANDKSGTGFFRWKEDICRTIEDHWDGLCPSRNRNIRTSGNWMNSISSILSANPSLFISGFNSIKQSGWWALKDPSAAPKVPETLKRGQPAVIDEKFLNVNRVDEEDGNVEVIGDASPKRKTPKKEAHNSSSSPGGGGKAKMTNVEPSSSRPISKPMSPSKALPKIPTNPTMQENKVQSAAALPIVAPKAPPPLPPSATANLIPHAPAAAGSHNHPLRMLAVRPPGGTSAAVDQNAAALEIKRKLVERLLRVDSELLKQALCKDTTTTTTGSGPLNPIMYVPPASAGSASSSPQKQVQPPKKKAKPAQYIRASPHENELVDLVSRVTNPDSQVLRLKRKLAVRKIKRMNGTQLFDLDTWIYLYLKAGNEPLKILDDSVPGLLRGLVQNQQQQQTPTQDNSDIFRGDLPDALVQAELSDIPFLRDPTLSFRAKLMGVTSLEGYPFQVESPYTGNKLPVYVYRQRKGLPAKIRLLQEIRGYKDYEKDETEEPEEKEEESLDFVHLRREHVPQVNRLLRAHFWPSIDISESLEWPDYCFTVLYRHLVIGCAICSPEGYLSYLFVLPEFRGSGLASKLLYFVIKSIRRDVTAHVAVGSEAMLVYQKFGFKPEEYIVDFYGERFRKQEDQEDEQVPVPARRNAFFLRFRQ